MVGSGAQFRSGLATTYVWLSEKKDVRLTSCPLVQSPGAIFGPRGLCVMVGSGAQFRSGLATTYVWLPEKVKCG